jgi:uncharacterized protein (UPF0548 family)
VRISFRPPSPPEIQAFLERQRDRSYSYPHVGASRGTPPTGWVVDHNRVCLGHGPDVFATARTAVGAWEVFRLGWVEVHGTGAPLAPGLAVAPVAHVFGVWIWNACRVVYTVEEDRRFGFAYGTLADHAERGEERFLVEWREDDSVWYDLLAFSRPGHWLVWLGFPVTRRLQKRFAAGSLAAMKRAARRM